MDDQELADKVLARLVRASEGSPAVRFMITPSIERSGGYRVSYPGGRFNAQLELIRNLIERRLVQVIEERSGSLVLGVTVRGFDYFSRELSSG